MFTYARVASALLCGALLPWLACSAGVKPTGTQGAAGTGGGSNPGAAGTSSSGAAGTGGSAPPLGGFGGSGMNNDSGVGCQHTQYTFEPKIPTVYLLVDRSGSMFHCLTGSTGDPVCATPTNTAWNGLKEAVRTVVGSLEKDVRFGFATIWGTDPAGGGMCPAIQGMVPDQVTPALNNATPIMTKYDALPLPPVSTQQGVKFESPASESLAAVGAALKADTSSQGDKYIIFITDGQPDYCDDSNSLCAPDSVIMHLQQNKADGITTIVLGIQTTLFDLGTGILQAYANAGAGEATVAPLRTGLDINAFYDQCNSVAGWKADLTASGKANARGTTLGNYMSAAGPTKPYMPSATDQASLVTQLSMALAGVKSCTFDLTATGGTPIKVDVKQLNKATIKIDGATQALDPNSMNGWNMINETTLQLFGSSCDAWRDQSAKTIDFNFPCEIIVPT
ncbi:MAG TPA: hypothetical protein VN903_02300 [Polyangia bacterium]|jgi:hypothetical protein|nr:hypothetical protein [Polyangia bacterium]